ncbi:MAG TPA: Lrp/AsnC family transcriptional regulator [bacterium]|nr:Lrp/AsnC family transcriptional regulator [bacterium]
MIDKLDREILAILRRNSCTPKAEVARQVGLAPTAVFERIRKLEERGVITGYQAQLDPKAFGQRLLAFVFVTGDRPAHGPDLGHLLAAIDGVEEVHVIAGEDCFLLKVRAADTDDLYRLLRERIGAIGGIHSVRTTIVLETVSEGRTVAWSADDDAAHGDYPSVRGDGPPPSLLSLVERKYPAAH